VLQHPSASTVARPAPIASFRHHQLGRPGMVHVARRACTYALVMNVWRSVPDREYPLIIVAAGPYVVRPLDANYRRVPGRDELGR
jgi:hypothetical protein